MKVRIETIESMPFAENSYVVWVEDRSDCLVVDPGFEPDAIEDVLKRLQLTPAAILNTHGHVDHIAGNAEMKRLYPNAPLIIGHGDAELLTDPMLNLSGQYGFRIISPTADRTVADGEELAIAGMNMLVREIPGHSPGHVVFILTDLEPRWVLGGDVLFAGGVGRTDFPGGNFNLLKTGIHTKLFPLPDDTTVFPGHGPVTTIGEEKATNPYVGLNAD